MDNWIDGKSSLEVDERKALNNVVEKMADEAQKKAWQEAHKAR